jgi:anti-sigma B factor antagonist
MNLQIEETDKKYVVTLQGEFDSPAVKDTEEMFEPLYTCGRDVVIDCSGLTYIASSGLRILLNILAGALKKNKSVVLKGANDDVMSIFKVTGFVDLFKFES